MDLTVQKRLASQIMKCSPKRVVFDTARTEEIKESVTKSDIRLLIKDRAIVVEQKKGVSRFRTRKNRGQKKKGRQKGQGSRKGTANARSNKKTEWINKVRLQRTFLKTLREKEMITSDTFRMLYCKSKGGFFRSKRHLQMYAEERKLITKKEVNQKPEQ